MALPPRAGAGLKPEHYRAILDTAPDIGWFEVHAENYMGAGGAPHHYLGAIRERYPISLHGVGLSIGGSGPLDREHLGRLRALIARYEPSLFSEHLAWSSHDGVYLNDLLPLPYTEETLARVCEHIEEVQETLGRRMLLENPLHLCRFRRCGDERDCVLARGCAPHGLRASARREQCVRPVRQSRLRCGPFIDAFPVEYVGEIHLGGHAVDSDEDDSALLIDDHGREVADAVWALYAQALARSDPKPTLIEWDNDVPAWDILFAEAKRADRIIADRRSNRIVA